MRRTGRLPWLLLVLWSTWIFALQARLTGLPGIGRWVPDVGLLLVLALDARVPRAAAWRVALVVGLARVATSADPPLAILAGYLGVVGVTGPLRELLLLEGPLARALLAGLFALLLGAFLVVARAASTPLTLLGAGPLEATWRPALATAVAASVALPLLRLLPGLSPLLKARR